MKSGSSSIGRELLWLLLFLALLFVFEYLMLRFVVPTGFNDRIAVLIAALVAGVVWILLRARWR
ncbi:MAG: hypothetical protein M3R30_00730 [Candidatus Eremiobacteraeota bacterium]|nr:hypothetical protein [Candidatus Eremiobacteraeota bacterium]